MQVLGLNTPYPSAYAPEILQPIARPHILPNIFGVDVWTAYELSWLNEHGKPVVFMGEIIFPYDSPFLIESKSLKLYLSSLHQERFVDVQQVMTLVQQELSARVQAPVEVQFFTLAEFAERPTVKILGTCLDDLNVEIKEYQTNAALLQLEAFEISETLYSHLLKTNCPVTGQPDWATVIIEYQGLRIQPESLLKYLVSFRMHTGFHEQCVEQIFQDLLTHCKPSALSVSAHYTRRGGLDINPLRSTHPKKYFGKICVRQ